MVSIGKKRITNAVVSALQPGESVRDTLIPGFMVRRQGDKRVFALQAAARGRRQYRTLGSWPAVSADEARRAALVARGEIERGLVPEKSTPEAAPEARKEDLTVAQLIESYAHALRSGIVSRRGKARKPGVAAELDIRRLELHVVPLIGHRAVASLKLHDIEDAKDRIALGETAKTERTGKARGLRRVQGGVGTATRTIATFAGVLSWGVRKGFLAHNPAVGVELVKGEARQRRMLDHEYPLIGEALRAMPAETWPLALAALHFACISGWRKGEIVGLRWAEIDLAGRKATLESTKSGRSTRPLSQAMVTLFQGLPRQSGGFVFPSARGGLQGGLDSIWQKVCARAGVEDLHLHDLRRSFNSLAADLGVSESIRSEIIGHRRQGINEVHYTMLSLAPLLVAADAVALETEKRMGYAKGTPSLRAVA